MPINEHPMQALAGFLPDKSFEQVLAYLHEYRVHLTITKQRKSVLGDYRHPGRGANHRISINGNLNKYEFLITFLHELAHLLTFEKFCGATNFSARYRKSTSKIYFKSSSYGRW
jgi:hypothetical protein